uniref:hypothetical protein n=1 Tax=Flavobacterium sp. TaxID=239 RepID=UPI004049B68C
MDIKNKLLKLLERRVFNAEELVEEIDKLYKQDQALQLQQTGVSGSVFDEIYSDLTTISASLLTKKLSEFEEDWNFCKTTPKKDIYKILNNVEFQNSIQRSLANKLSSVKDKFFKHYR